MADRQPYLGPHVKAGTRTPYLGGTATPAKKPGGHGFLHALEKYSGAEIAGNLAKDVGKAALGVGPGLYNAGHALEKGTKAALTGDTEGLHKFNKNLEGGAKTVGKQYADYYGHDIGHHLYTHPLQPILDALTVASAGVGAATKVGELSNIDRLVQLGQRGEIVTRSPRAIATGKGPVHTDLTSTKPLVKAREQTTQAIRQHPKMVERRGGELQQYGKQIQQHASHDALSRLTQLEPYTKATRRLSKDEWTALHIRALDVHPDDLKALWHGTPAEKLLTPKVARLSVQPTKRMLGAEPEARRLAEAGKRIFQEKGLLKEDVAANRPALTKRQAAEVLGRPVKEITGQPYYFPHTLEQRPVNPLVSAGGGKGVPRKLGSMKQSTGTLALKGKLHLRSDVLGPEFLRRVKFVKYDEVHNALVRGSVRVSRKQIEEQYGGHLPKGWEYVRTKPSTRIPPSIRAEGDQHIPIDKLVPNPEDLHNSPLAEGFSTPDINQAHEIKGHYFIVPNRTVKAATGEFTKTSDFTRAFVSRPLKVWRAAVLGLRVGFLTNNLIGNSVMYAVKTGGNGAIRDLFGAIMESHGPQVAKGILDDPATPPALRNDLYKEFFPEQVHGTFGRTQSPATSPAHIAGRKATEIGRAVTGAIPSLTSKVAEEYPRRALIRNAIRHSPEFRTVYKALPAQTRTFETAARQVLEGKGGAAFQRRVSKQVNQALGDYLNLSPFERNVMRNALPFYAWYRAITTTTYHLAADTPLRANLLAQIGRIGDDKNAETLGEVPTFLRDAIPLGAGANGTKRVLGTQGLNPYGTLEQLHRGVTQDVTSLGLNPFPVAVAQAFQQAKDGNISPGKLAVDALESIVRGLPPSRLIAPLPPSKLYPNRNRKSELLAFLGAPVKEYNPAAAADQARKGR